MSKAGIIGVAVLWAGVGSCIGALNLWGPEATFLGVCAIVFTTLAYCLGRDIERG